MGWGVAVQGPRAAVEHAVDVVANIVVPESDDSIADALHPRCSLAIGACGVLASVDFNDQPALVTNEIGYVVSEWNLSAKPKPT